MDAVLDCTASDSPQESPHRSRRWVAEKMAEFWASDSSWTSHRQIAAQLEVPPRNAAPLDPPGVGFVAYVGVEGLAGQWGPRVT